MRDNKELTKYVASFLLGDGSISIDKRNWGKKGNASFECTHTIDHLDYLEYKMNILQDITTASIQPGHKEHWQKFPNSEKLRFCKETIRVRTSRHPFFNAFRNRLYLEGRRTLDPHYFTLFDWETLAIWYMDDGYLAFDLCKGKYPRYRIGFSTNRYTYAENLLLKDLLKEKFYLEFNIHKAGKTQFGLRLGYKDQVSKFIDNVSKYIIPSFEYKISRTETPSKIEGDDIV